jgi:aspartate/methionine/tyrosine aminotransferase
VARVSERLGRLSGSATLAINNRAREMAAEGRDVISFGAGEPDFPTPEHIVEAAARAAADPGNHHYTANVGLPILREAISEYTLAYSRVAVEDMQILVTNGAKQAIFQSFAALLDPGDEALLPAPHWVTYPSGIELAGGVAVSVPTRMEDGFKVDVEALESDWARDRDIWVLADEIYQRLVYHDREVAPSIAAVTDGLHNVVLVNGVAKSFAMTGWRVGWMIGPPDVVGAAARHQSHATGNVNNVGQMAALEAITGPQDTVLAMRETFDKRRQAMMSMLSDAPGVQCAEPSGAFYVFPSVEGLLNDAYPTSEMLAEGLLEEVGVAVVPGASFGAPGFLRLSYALSDSDLERGVSMMLGMFGRL